MFGEYFVILRIMASFFAFCIFLTITQAQADPRLEEDLFLRNMLLRQFANSRMSGLIDGINLGLAQAEENRNEEISKRVASDFPFTNNGLWRLRRSPTEMELNVPKRLLRLSDQYTPTPCRWKLCASFFKKGAF